MADAAVEDPESALRMREKHRIYHDFLRVNYSVFNKYVQIRRIYSFSMGRTHAERLREQEQLAAVNAVLTDLKNLILSLEKNSESLLFSD